MTLPGFKDSLDNQKVTEVLIYRFVTGSNPTEITFKVSGESMGITLMNRRGQAIQGKNALTERGRGCLG